MGMEDPCCAPLPQGQDVRLCKCRGSRSHGVALITLKALLTPAALARLNPEEAFRFCPELACDVVYFSPTLTFRASGFCQVKFG